MESTPADWSEAVLQTKQLGVSERRIFRADTPQFGAVDGRHRIEELGLEKLF